MNTRALAARLGIGQEIGDFIVVAESTRKLGKRHWMVKCKHCRAEKDVRELNLLRGKARCRIVPDLTGQHFGMLFIIGKADDRGDGVTRYHAHCDCGKDCIKTAWEIRRSSRPVRSCGCLRGSKTKERPRKLSDEEYIQNQIIQAYRSSARRRKKSWNLSREQAMELFKADCHYCGAEPSNTKTIKGTPCQGSSWTYNGIDRVDSSRGYEVGNVVSCCLTCNRAKGTKSQEEFRSWALRLAKSLS